MASTHWGHDESPNIQLWDDLYWVLGQWICQREALVGQDPEDPHIANPAIDNTPCESCLDVAFGVMDGLRKLLQVFGSVAYASGKDGVPENEAAWRALETMIKRSHDTERAKVLLARKCCN